MQKLKRYDCHNNGTIFNTESWCKDSDVSALEVENDRMKSAFRYLLAMGFDQVSKEARNVIYEIV